MVPLKTPSPSSKTPLALQIVHTAQPETKAPSPLPAQPAAKPQRWRGLIAVLKSVIGLLPPGSPTWVYSTLLKPRLLRRLTDALLLGMIPPQVCLHDVTVVLNPADPVVSSALTLGIYETFETALVQKHVQPGMRVLDIGANVGYYTALFSRLVGPQGSVIAFEPEPGNFTFLQRTIAANQFAQAKAVKGAVAQKSGESFLFLSELNQGDHRLYATAGRSKIAVPILSIDSYLPPNAQVDFIKMDIQGSEGLALQGMRETIQRSPQVQILTEFWPEGLRDAGVDPRQFLRTLQDELGLNLWEVDTVHQRLERVADCDRLIARHPGRDYTNLFCTRSESKP